MNKNPFEIYKHIHFIGIGGIGVSAIARMFRSQGKTIIGSDMSQSEITDDLQKEGIEIYIGHDKKHVAMETDLVVHTIAIPESNPELQTARERGIKTMTYPEVLGELSKTMYTIAVAGTHGKTTTTAMIGHIMEEAGLKPTVIVGSKLIGKESNFVSGDGTYLVIEACEYKRSFLNLYPDMLVMTNIEADHLDYYKDIRDIQSAFHELAGRVPKEGHIICNPQGANIEEVIVSCSATIVDYTDVFSDIVLTVPGKHNTENAQASGAVASVLNVSEEVSRKALKDFKGTWRRLEHKGAFLGMPVYDDYAHHPTAIRVGIAALREMYPHHKIVCVFEPHQQQRVKNFMQDFVLALSRADQVFVAPIYMAREEIDSTVSHSILAGYIKHAEAVDTPDNLVDKLHALPDKEQTVIVMMGAGHMHEWALHLMKI